MADERPGEFELIRTYFAPLAADPGSLGLTDDASVFTPKAGYDLVLTKDVLAADIHFFASDEPEAIAAKALRVNLSDLAAKGAVPRGYLLGLALPSDWTPTWLERFCKGLAGDQSWFDIQLWGGDTIRSGNGLQVSITAIGEVPEGKAVRRSGARPGDVLLVSGTIGDAAAGLKARLDTAFCKDNGLSNEEARHVLGRYLLPQPRTVLSELILSHASAAMDVSDGLLSDAAHLAEASGVNIFIDIDQVPLSSALQRLKKQSPTSFKECLNGGDDYEILASVPEEQVPELIDKAGCQGCALSVIGQVEEGEGAVTVQQAGVRLETAFEGGFRHF